MNCRYQDAETLFLEMKKQGIEPSKYTYTTMINVWSKAGRFASAAGALAEMEKMGSVLTRWSIAPSSTCTARLVCTRRLRRSSKRWPT